MVYPSGVIKRWVNVDLVDVLVDLGFNIFTTRRFRLAGLGDYIAESIDLPVFLEKIQRIAPVNTQVSIECFGDDHNGNWIGNVILPDGTLVNDLLIQEGLSNFIKTYR